MWHLLWISGWIVAQAWLFLPKDAPWGGWRADARWRAIHVAGPWAVLVLSAMGWSCPLTSGELLLREWAYGTPAAQDWAGLALQRALYWAWDPGAYALVYTGARRSGER